MADPILTSSPTAKLAQNDINEKNWQGFQGSNPDAPNYQPQSLIDYYRTGKTTSQLADEGAIPSTTVQKPTSKYGDNPNLMQRFAEWANEPGNEPSDPMDLT